MLQLLIVIRLASFRWPKISCWSFWSVYKYFNTLTFYCYKCFQFCLFRYFVFTTEVFLLIGVVVFLLLLLLILFDWLLLVFSLSVSSVSLPCWCCHTCVHFVFFFVVLFFVAWLILVVSLTVVVTPASPAPLTSHCPTPILCCAYTLRHIPTIPYHWYDTNHRTNIPNNHCLERSKNQAKAASNNKHQQSTGTNIPTNPKQGKIDCT